MTGGNEGRIDRLMTHNPSVTPPTCLQNLHCMRGQWSYDEAADIILGLNSMRAKEAQILKESSWGSSVRAQARGRPESKAARAQPTLRSSGFTLGVLNSEYTGGERGQKREHARTRSTNPHATRCRERQGGLHRKPSRPRATLAQAPGSWGESTWMPNGASTCALACK